MLSEVHCPCPVLCRPSTLHPFLLSPRQTSFHALCSLDVCALNSSPPLHSHSASSASPTLTLHCPPTRLPPSSPGARAAPLSTRSSGSLKPPHYPLFLPRSGAHCRGRGMCPRLEVQRVKHTTCAFCWGRKQQYYGVRTDGCQFPSSSQ